MKQKRERKKTITSLWKSINLWEKARQEFISIVACSHLMFKSILNDATNAFQTKNQNLFRNAQPNIVSEEQIYCVYAN